MQDFGDENLSPELIELNNCGYKAVIKAEDLVLGEKYLMSRSNFLSGESRSNSCVVKEK